MPSRTVHNDFARIFGIDLSIANRVNHEMDRPARYLGPSHRKVNHDAVFVAKMAQKYGLQGAQAAALHIMLDLATKYNPALRKAFKLYEIARGF